MPFTEWYLKPWDTYHHLQGPAIKVEVDPAKVAGGRGIFGPMLFRPYTLPTPDEASASLRLLSLKAWVGYGNVADSTARLLIPSQIIWPTPQYRLQVPLTDMQIEAIEEERKGERVNLTVWLGGLAYMGRAVVPVQSTTSGYLGIEREHWLTVLRDLDAGARRLVELPEPRLPQQREDDISIPGSRRSRIGSVLHGPTTA